MARVAAAALEPFRSRFRYEADLLIGLAAGSRGKGGDAELCGVRMDPGLAEYAFALVLELSDGARGLEYTAPESVGRTSRGDFSATYDPSDFGVAPINVATKFGFNKFWPTAREDDNVLVEDVTFAGFADQSSHQDEAGAG